jgi:hypothetical protein
MSARHRTADFIPPGQPFVFLRKDEPIAKRVQSAKLREACKAAFVFIEDYRRELLGSYCLHGADGAPILMSLGGYAPEEQAESEHMREVEALLKQLINALQGTMLP